VRVDRRTTLKWLFATIAASQGGCAHKRGNNGTATTASEPLLGTAAPVNGVGYGTDPDLTNPAVPWTLTMTNAQLEVTTALCDAILPADDRSPAASALGVPDFIDEWISAPYPRQREDRQLILEGLEWLEQECRRRYGSGFAASAENHKGELLDELAGPDDDTAALAAYRSFFDRFRYLCVGAFYSTAPGARDAGYVGNVPIVGEYPGPSDAALEHLARVLDELGLELEN
jgi:hypothetical protein